MPPSARPCTPRPFRFHSVGPFNAVRAFQYSPQGWIGEINRIFGPTYGIICVDLRMAEEWMPESKEWKSKITDLELESHGGDPEVDRAAVLNWLKAKNFEIGV